MTGALIAECVLRIATALALLGFSGCASNDAPAPSGQPSFYRNLAEGGQLDPAAAQSMISGYRANNGLGGVVIDPALMKLAEEQSRAMVARDKLVYHTAITAKLGIAMPTAEEESVSPDKADDIYVGATKRLRELTRSNKQLLLKENIAYGFHRNMLAMKPVGIVSCRLGIVYGLLIAKILQVVPPHFDPVHLADPGLAAGLTLLISLALLAAWLLYFEQGAVRRMGFVYAERLFECLPSLPSSAPRKRASKPTTD